MHAVARGEVRIASLVPSLTETLFALGLGDSVVARTGFCVHPRARVKRVPRVGGTKDPDLSKLAALRPTHLVVNVDENRVDDVERARAFVANVIVTHPLRPEDNARLVMLLGAIFDREAPAYALAADIDAALGELGGVAKRVLRERVLYVIWRKPWMTVARDTYVSATLERAGWDTLPVESKRRYPVVAEDDAAWRSADRILLSTEPYAFRERDVAAVRQATGRPVQLVDGEWTSWYGARAREGLRALAAFRRSVASA